LSNQKSAVLLDVGIAHVYFVSVYRSGEETGRTVIEKRNALNHWESFRGVGSPLHGLVFHKVGVDRLGIEVIVFGQVEHPSKSTTVEKIDLAWQYFLAYRKTSLLKCPVVV
jgi:hypothetical protein